MSDEKDQILSGILTKYFTEMADAVEEYMRQARDQISEERKEYFTPKINSLQENLNQQIEEFQEMQDTANDTNNKFAKKDAIRNQLVTCSFKLHQKVRNSNLLARAFNAWKKIGTEKALLAKVFKRNFIRNALRRIYFKRWIRRMIAKRENRVSSEIKRRYEKIWKAKAMEAQRTIEQLEQELASAREELETKQRKFLEMQQRLRKAFMRGVVNLNLEAMDVFNGAQFMDLMQEVENNEIDHQDDETAVNESDDDFYVEEAPPISVIRHR